MQEITQDSPIRYEFGPKQRVVKAGSLTPMKAIRAKCLDCSGGNATEVKLCTCQDCPLYPFRLGMPKWRKRVVTDEQRAIMRKKAVERGLGTDIQRK
jgi:hypothetical protein